MSIRLIPVLDLKGGVAVHAVRGERDRYQPVRSVLADSADPVALGRAFRDRLGCRECYVADLDAIGGRGRHAREVRALADLGLRVWLDAGVRGPDDARRARDQGAGRVILGTETLAATADLSPILAALAGGSEGEDSAAEGSARADAILSLDLKAGQLLGGSAEVAALPPLEVARRAWAAGVRAFIVLELARVGTGGGPDAGLAGPLRAALPAAEVAVGGGVRDAADLARLAAAGIDAALVGTALHTGALPGPSSAAGAQGA